MSGINFLPTDDWPFLYLREPTIPGLNLRWIAMVAVLSLVILFLYAPVRTFKPNGQMFFLGAGFMLLETKGVVQMALLFGSTWMVNSIIFFAILVMVLLSNLFVLWFKPGKRWGLFYGLLIGTLTINALVPMDSYLGLSGMTRMVVVIHFRLHPSLLRGHHLRDGISGQPSARYRYRFEYWWSDPWGPERISLIDDGFQLASRPRHLFLLALSPHGGAAVAGPAIGQDRASRLLIRPLSVRGA